MSFSYLMLAMLLINLALLALAVALLLRQAHRRGELTARLEQQREQFEQQVRRRTAELSALSSHLQHLSEKEKAALARELHDELGGLLIAVKMDVVVAAEALAQSGDPDIQARWARVLKVLDDGVDFKRRIVENLRPTLLDNMGLLPAVRWITQETCSRAGLHYTEIYPEQEPVLTDDAAIMVFRLVQESLINIVKHARATEVRSRSMSTISDLTDPDRGQRHRHRIGSARGGRLPWAGHHAASRAQLWRHVSISMLAAGGRHAHACAACRWRGSCAAPPSALAALARRPGLSERARRARRRSVQRLSGRSALSAPICCSSVGRRSKSRSLSRKWRAPSAAAARRYSARS